MRWRLRLWFLMRSMAAIRGFVFVQAAVSYAVVDLGHGLHDGASRAEVEVADFGVAH